MKDTVFLVDRQKKLLSPVEMTRFSEMGVRERQDFQEWICTNLAILGEELFLISTEFNGFDNSKRRIDLLALDKCGKLVIIELKLELEGNFADLQALRYASFFSSFTRDDVVDIHAKFNNKTNEESQQEIADFLCGTPLVLDGRPRIILAASKIDDQELTSTVLWLRTFRIDITCVEISPYVVQPGDIHILVPKTIIPLPETNDYIIRKERKEAEEISQSEEKHEYMNFWRQLSSKYESLSPSIGFGETTSDWYKHLHKDRSGYWYEWQVSKRPREIKVAISFRTKDQQLNVDCAEHILKHITKLTTSSNHDSLNAGPWGRNNERAWVYISIPYTKTFLDTEIVESAANTMNQMVKSTQDELQRYFSERQ